MGKFQNGHKKLGGKTKGTKNVKTQEWEQLGEFLTKEGAERVVAIMATANDKQFMAYYNQLLEHFKPKLQRTILEGNPEAPLTWNETKQYPATNGKLNGTHIKANGST